MRKLILTAVMAATMLPVATAASAQSAGELQRDRRDIREERRDVRDAERRGDPRDVREQRRDVRDARQEYREDRRDRVDDRDRAWARNDWSGWRDRNPGFYQRGGWRAPFRYTPFRPGLRIGAPYYGPRYVIADPWRYHLPRAGWGQRWVRHYDDVILVDTRRGVVIDVIRGFYR